MLAGRIKLYPKLPWTRDREISCKGDIFQRISTNENLKNESVITKNWKRAINEVPPRNWLSTIQLGLVRWTCRAEWLLTKWKRIKWLPRSKWRPGLVRWKIISGRNQFFFTVYRLRCVYRNFYLVNKYII